MNKITLKLLSIIGPIVIENILNSIINDKKLTSFRDGLISYFRRTADKTVTELDDYLVEFAVDTIMEPGKYKANTMELCGIFRAYIQDSTTEWDDIVFLPILERIEELGTTPV